MIPTTILENKENQRQWKRTPFGVVKLCCPYCFKWFALGPDFMIEDDGTVRETIYHVCDADSTDSDDEENEAGPEDGRAGWVACVQLKGWGE